MHAGGHRFDPVHLHQEIGEELEVRSEEYKSSVFSPHERVFGGLGFIRFPAVITVLTDPVAVFVLCQHTKIADGLGVLVVSSPRPAR